MKLPFKHFIGTLFVLASLVFGLTGCPKAEKTVRTAREKSAEIAVYGEKLIQANIDAFKAGEISQATLADLNKVTRVFVDGVGHYRSAIAAAELAVKNGTGDQSTVDTLYNVFDEKVVAAFFAILEKFSVLSGPHVETAKTIIAAIRLTIRAIQGAFSDARYQLELGEVNYVAA